MEYQWMCLTLGVSCTALNAEELFDLPLDKLLQIPITAASRYQQTSLDTPATVIVITERQIRERRYFNLADLLSDLPSISVQRRADPTRQNWLTINGLGGSNRMLIFQDGVRIDSPTGDVISIDQNFPLFAAKRVEVLYGPAAAVYGADAFGGVINIVTREPSSATSAQWQVRAGTADYRYLDFALAQAFDTGWKLSLAAHQHQDRLAEQPNDTGIMQATDAINFAGQVVVPADAREPYQAPITSDSRSLRLTYADSLELGYHYWSFQQQSNQSFRRQEALALDQDISLTSVTSLYLRYQWQLSERLHNKILADQNRFEIHPETRFDNIFSNFKPAYKYALGQKRSWEDQLDFRLNEQQRITGGLGYEWFSLIPRTADLPQAFDPSRSVAEQQQYYPNTNLQIQIYDFDYNNKFMYSQWEAKWTNEFSTTAGIRYDQHSLYGSSRNPRLGLVYQPLDSTVIKVSYGQAFRAPSLTAESYVNFGSFSGETNASGQYIGRGFRVPNPQLKPERLRGWELALLQRLNNHWDFSARGYRYQMEDLIQGSAEANPPQFIPGAQLINASMLKNQDSALSYGVDLGLESQHNLTNAWTMQWWGYYSFQDGYLFSQNLKQDLPHNSTNQLKMGATFNYQNDYFITSKWYVSDRTNSNINDPADNSKKRQTPGYALVDLHLGVNGIADTNINVNLDIYNLLDRNYYHAVFDNSGGRSPAGIAQPERTWMVSLGWQLE